MPRNSGTSLELEGHLHQQAPQHTTTADLQLYFNLIYKFNNTHILTRDKKQAAIKEDIKHVLEQLWILTPEDTPYKIFAGEARLGAHDVLVLSKEYLREL